MLNIQWSNQKGGLGGREDTKNMHEIILASTNCMDTLCTGQDNG